MRASLRYLVVTVALLGLTQQAMATATWEYHFKSNYVHPNETGPCQGGHLTVYGTINCQPQEPPLFEGQIIRCDTYSGAIPPGMNDFMTIFDWDYACQNHDEYKTVVPTQPDPNGPWALEELAPWIEAHPLDWMPTLGDPTGSVQNIYVVVDLVTWYQAAPVPMLDWYDIFDGTCPDLPGYHIFDSPYSFDPNAPFPFVGTPFTGTLEADAEVHLYPEPASLILIMALAAGLRRRR